PLAEKNFRRAMVISEGSFSIFFTRPISCAFIVIAIGSVLVFAYKNYRTRKRIKEAAKQQ
ncbi:MAG: C4-dicarboxylate ABC transporter permease, partial [Clostridia bacterium]|nr:C4-dicarboxylate ABC transporter permease [Clostridia bacterium]